MQSITGPSQPRTTALARTAASWRCLLLLGLATALQAVQAPPDRITLQLKWHHQFQFAGYYAAQEQGYYRDAGLEVETVEAEPGVDIVKEVVSGRAQYGVGNSALLLSRQKGQPVVVLAAVFQHSPLILMTRADSGINTVHDLVGKRLMIERQADELIAYLRKEGVSEQSLTLLNHSFDPNDLIQGKVDCISAYVTDETYFLEKAGHKVLEFSPRMGGIDFYGDNLFTSEAELKAHPARVRAFREASMKGWKYAMQHPAEIADRIIARYGQRRGRDYLLYEAQKMVTLLQPSLVEMGYMYPGRWQHIVDTYRDLGLLPKAFRLEGFLYDPEAGTRQDVRRLGTALAVMLILGCLLGGVALVFLRLNLRLRREIASRERAEEAIRLEHEKAEGYLRVAEVILVALDPMGRVTLLNRKGYAVLGYEPGELLGRDWYAICMPAATRQATFARFQQVLSGAAEPRLYSEGELVRKDGSLRLIAWHNTLIRDRQDRITGLLASGEDITERRKAEREKAELQAQLQQAQKMESLGSLAGGVAHDMNNVLGAILGMASAHIETQPDGSPTYRAFDTIIRAAERGGKMVKGLLSFARVSPSQEQELDLNAILREEAQLLEHTTLARVRLELELAAGLSPIRGDAGALSHAFMNLCVNAVDAMADGGTLTVRTGNAGDGWVEVVVTDTGAGMAPEVLERAMDPFFTTKPQGQGTGLGLSLVYSTVKAHQGQLRIESEPDRGTRVLLRFPACAGAAPSPRPAAVTAPDGRSLNVLLVDDEDLVRGSMLEILEVLGHRAHEACSGEEALAMLEAGLEPDLVMMDMNMPGLGGAGSLPLLRARHPELPVLLVTGRADRSAQDLVEAHSGVTLLAKPFTMRELQQHLGNLR
jgi:PAS domain S-box-containing protein